MKRALFLCTGNSYRVRTLYNDRRQIFDFSCYKKIFEMVFDKEEIAAIDRLPHATVSRKLWPEVLAETYGSEDEEKN